MGRKSVLLAVVLATMLTVTGVFTGGQLEAAGGSGEVYNVKMSSAEVDGDFMTVWANNFADYMREETGGKFNIEVLSLIHI